MNNLGIRYSEVGRRADAVAPTEEAVTLYRGTGRRQPRLPARPRQRAEQPRQPLQRGGRRADAVAPTEEAVTLYRAPGRRQPRLPARPRRWPSNNLGVRYSEVGRRADALAPTEEAVTTLPRAGRRQPRLPARPRQRLNNLGIRYSGLGRRADALAPTEEAVTLRRALAADNPAYLPDLASALNNLGIRYSEVGRRADAVAPTEEAVDHLPGAGRRQPRLPARPRRRAEQPRHPLQRGGRTRRRARAHRGSRRPSTATLAADNPAFLPDLASALNNLGVRYSEVGRRAEAVAPDRGSRHPATGTWPRQPRLPARPRQGVEQPRHPLPGGGMARATRSRSGGAALADAHLLARPLISCCARAAAEPADARGRRVAEHRTAAAARRPGAARRTARRGHADTAVADPTAFDRAWATPPGRHRTG